MHFLGLFVIAGYTTLLFLTMRSSNNCACEKQLDVHQCLYLSVSAQLSSRVGLPSNSCLFPVYNMSTCMANVSHSAISWDCICVLILALLNKIAYLF